MTSAFNLESGVRRAVKDWHASAKSSENRRSADLAINSAELSGKRLKKHAGGRGYGCWSGPE